MSDSDVEQFRREYIQEPADGALLDYLRMAQVRGPESITTEMRNALLAFTPELLMAEAKMIQEGLPVGLSLFMWGFATGFQWSEASR